MSNTIFVDLDLTFVCEKIWLLNAEMGPVFEYDINFSSYRIFLRCLKNHYNIVSYNFFSYFIECFKHMDTMENKENIVWIKFVQIHLVHIKNIVTVR